ncbi:MAG: family 16 glycosylhydrolase, partial [Caldilineaceae bacterium]|nr:family 16 glycosylhydrolase [Caldilineaceae bacterium]
ADFEGGAPTGWFTYAGGSTVDTVTQVVGAGDALALPDQAGDNEILAATYNIVDFGGFGQDIAVSAGGPQDWSNFPSFDFWFYGTGSGLTYQAEISDNRSDPNTDTSERFDYEFTDTTAGWQFISIPFADFTRATDFQPAGAPDDGFTLTEIWAWAIVLPVGSDTVYFDNFALGEHVVDDFESGLPSGVDGDGIAVGFYTFSDGSPVAITTTTTLPAPVPGIGDPNAVLRMDADIVAYAGFIHGFTNDTADTWVTQDWSTYAGMRFWFYGENSGTDLFVDILDNRSPGSTSDDAERWTVAFKDDFSGWQVVELPFADFTRKEIGNGAPNDGLTLTEMHGWAFGALNTGGPRSFYLDNVTLYGIAKPPELAVSFAAGNFNITEGTTGDVVVRLNRPMTDGDPAQVAVDYSTEPGTAIPGRDYTPTSGTLTFVKDGPSEQSFALETFGDNKALGNTRVVLRLSNFISVTTLMGQASAIIVDDDLVDPNLIDDFERGAYLWQADNGATLDAMEITAGDAMALPGQGAYENILTVTPADAATPADFGRDFALGQDWSRGQALRFWYYGRNSGDTIGVTLKDNRAADPGPAGWSLVWNDEFDDPAGTPPNPANWTHEIGDVTPDGKNGWGNEELQYYTDSTDNAATDGNGNLVISVKEADGSLTCYYGPCEYTSARLLSWHKAEFAYGRIEARIQVPDAVGIWPAFWSLGTNIDLTPWPAAGEIDYMEFVGRVPNDTRSSAPSTGRVTPAARASAAPTTSVSRSTTTTTPSPWSGSPI